SADLERVAFQAHTRPERRQDLRHEFDVAEIRDAVDDAWLGGEQRGRHDGKHGVFGAANLHIPAQWNAAANQQTVHDNLKFFLIIRALLIRTTRDQDSHAVSVVSSHGFDNPLLLFKKFL